MKIVVTGAASGIGRGLAERLAARGDTVVAADLAPLQAAAPNLIPIRLDVREATDWAALVAAHPDLDAVCNIAGVLRPAWISDLRAEDITLQLDVNVKGMILGTQAATRAMLVHRGSGRRIVNLASLAGVLPLPGNSVYAASKFAARGFSLAAAAELGPHGIHVSVVCPAGVQTPMLDLQKRRPEAALTFASRRDLSVSEVVDALLRVLDAQKPPTEVLLPAASGWLAKYLALSAWSYFPLVRELTHAGQRRQRALTDSTPLQGNTP